ncbi:MAG: alpha/beta fold hydrolase [Pseudomonadota bacterium]
MTDNTLIDRRFVRLDHGLVHLRQAGADDAPPLLMLHASPASSKPLEPLIAALAPHYRVYAADTPGNGESGPLDLAGPSLADYARVMDDLCAALGHEKVALYGTHTGAHIAIAWASRFPARLQSMVLDGVALLGPQMRQEFLERYAPHKQPEPDGSQFHWAWQFMRDQMIFFPHYKKDLEHLRPGGTFDAQVLHDLTLDVLKALDTYHLPYEAVFRQDPIAEATEANVPALVLTSDDGPIESGMEPLIEALPQAVTAQTDGTLAKKAAAIATFLGDAP